MLDAVRIAIRLRHARWPHPPTRAWLGGAWRPLAGTPTPILQVGGQRPEAGGRTGQASGTGRKGVSKGRAAAGFLYSAILRSLLARDVRHGGDRGLRPSVRWLFRTAPALQTGTASQPPSGRVLSAAQFVVQRFPGAFSWMLWGISHIPFRSGWAGGQRDLWIRERCGSRIAARISSGAFLGRDGLVGSEENRTKRCPKLSSRRNSGILRSSPG
jgi:hypothetical protein